MTRKRPICTSISRIAISLLLAAMAATTATAQGFLKFERDSIPFFRGFAVGADVAGALQMQLGGYGQYEAFLRVNLHDQYFPTLELGYGKASHEDDIVTGISYRTKAPYFRLGADVNLLKKKHTGNRIFVGLRYGFTSYKIDLDRQPFPDPVWQWDTSYGVKDESCSSALMQRWRVPCTWGGACATGDGSCMMKASSTRRGMCQAMVSRRAPGWAIPST